MTGDQVVASFAFLTLLRHKLLIHTMNHIPIHSSQLINKNAYFSHVEAVLALF